MAARNRTEEDLIKLSDSLLDYSNKISSSNQGIEEDLMFHIKIAEASKNNVLKSLMMIITPDIVKKFIEYEVCGEVKNQKTIEEHQKILEMITAQDEIGAMNAMEEHLQDIKNFNRINNT